MGGETAAAFFASHGLSDPEALARIRARSSYYPSMVPQVPASFRRLMGGKTLQIGGQSWQCLVGYGHAPEHISLYCAALGLHPFDVLFYRPPAVLITNNRSAPATHEFTLAQARRHLGLDPEPAQDRESR